MRSRVQKLYDKTADIYDSRYRALQTQKYAIMLEDLAIQKPILDLGCGTGLLQSFLNTELFGVDISFQSLKKSKEQAVQGYAELLPFKDNSFGAVLCFTVAQNLDNAEKVLQEIRRVLKPKGIAAVTVLAKFAHKLDSAEKYFRILELKKCGEDAGLVLTPRK